MAAPSRWSRRGPRARSSPCAFRHDSIALHRLESLKTHVLIVEDDANLRLTLQDNLEEQGYQVRVAASVAEGWKALDARAADVVVLDLMLPDGDGYDFCKKLREKRLPSRVLMLTARSLEEDLVRGFDAGADDYLAKPYRLRELYARIAALVRRGAGGGGGPGGAPPLRAVAPRGEAGPRAGAG